MRNVDVETKRVSAGKIGASPLTDRDGRAFDTIVAPQQVAQQRPAQRQPPPVGGHSEGGETAEVIRAKGRQEALRFGRRGLGQSGERQMDRSDRLVHAWEMSAPVKSAAIPSRRLFGRKSVQCSST